MESKSRRAFLADTGKRHVFTDEQAVRICWEYVKHLKSPIKTIQRDIRALVGSGDLDVTGLVMAGKRRKQLVGKVKIGPNMAEHEKAVTEALIGLGRLDAKRWKEVHKSYRPDAEFDDWYLEIDMGTESKGKVEQRIRILSGAPNRFLFVVPSATRLHRIGTLAKPLGDRVWFTNLQYISERWIDHKGEPVSALLGEN